MSELSRQLQAEQPASPSAYHRNLAKAVLRPLGYSTEHDYFEIIADVLASEGVVDLKAYQRVCEARAALMADADVQNTAAVVTERDDLRVEIGQLRAALRNLMAVINRDGGDWAARFGTDEEAAADAQNKVAGIFAKIEQLREDLKEESALTTVLQDRANVEAAALEKSANDLENFMAPEGWSDEKKDGAYQMSYIVAEKFQAKAKAVRSMTPKNGGTS